MTSNKLRVVQVANSFLELSEKYGLALTNLSLQKLIFFAQGFFLLRFDDLMFQDEIQAWEYSPVVPEIYYEFKRFGRHKIKSRASFYIPEMEEPSFPGVDEKKSYDAFLVVNDTLALLGGKDPFELVEYSHRDQSPWTLAIKANGGQIGRHVPIEITSAHKGYFEQVYREVKAEYDEWVEKNKDFP